MGGVKKIVSGVFGGGSSSAERAAQAQAEQARKEAEELKRQQAEEKAKADRLEKAQKDAMSRRALGKQSLMTEDGEDTSAVKRKSLLGG